MADKDKTLTDIRRKITEGRTSTTLHFEEPMDISMKEQTMPKKETANERLNALLDEFNAKNKLRGWRAFVEDLDVPGDLLPALMSGRIELIKLVKPRRLTEDEHSTYLKLIAGLIETNVALANHAQETAKLVDNWNSMLSGLMGTANRILLFANFRNTESEEDDT